MRQSGVVMLPPAGAVLAALGVRAKDRASLAVVLRRLSLAIGQVMARFAGMGRPVEVTVAVGASLFDGRFGLGLVRPCGLVDMPVFLNDALDPAHCHGEPVWAAGGTYQVVRVIRFATALWDGESLGRQEAVFGRRKADGVPLSGEGESFDYRADPSGQLIALDAHIRRANPRMPETAGSRILRRGYSYRGGVDAAGRRDEGMLFVCFQQDVERGFATVQRRLAGEALDRYVLPVGGGYFFVLPGVSGSEGDYLGRALIDAAG